MDDLISRKAAMDCCFKPQVRPNAEIFNALKMAIRSEISVLQSVPAVPLDKLCEWLAEHYGSPCQLAEIDCYPQCEPDENGECYGMRADDKRCWRDYLTKWMEGLDAAD